MDIACNYVETREYLWSCNKPEKNYEFDVG